MQYRDAQAFQGASPTEAPDACCLLLAAQLPGEEGPTSTGSAPAGLRACCSRKHRHMHAYMLYPDPDATHPTLHIPAPPRRAAPYADPAASAAVAAIMERVDFPQLLRRVDQGYESWRQPSLLLFGTSGEGRQARGAQPSGRP